jgi:hypothetical protein
MSEETKTQFEQASTKKDSNLAVEFWAMLRQNKKYWMIPLVVGLLSLGLLVLLGGTSAAPFIYSLF